MSTVGEKRGEADRGPQAEQKLSGEGTGGLFFLRKVKIDDFW